MDEDQLRTGLRRLADVDPLVRVDRADVLRAGRRRRRARATGTGAAVLALALGAYPAVAALTPDPSPAPPAGPTATVSPAPRAVVDHEAGTITLPPDPLALDEDQSLVLATATEHFLSACMQARGFTEGWEFRALVRQPPGANLARLYGVWRADDVRANGYAHILSDLTVRSLGPEESEAVSECHDAMASAGLGVSPQDRLALSQEHGATGRVTALATDDGRTLRDQWARCLAEDGVEVEEDRESLIPEGVRGAPLEEQVRIGLIDVACKDRLDLVQRLADIDAELDADMMARTQEYRIDLRRLEEAAVEPARQYLAEQGVTVAQDVPER